MNNKFDVSSDFFSNKKFSLSNEVHIVSADNLVHSVLPQEKNQTYTCIHGQFVEV